MRLAVVGAGVSGLAAAYWLSRVHDVTLFEAEKRLGGHTHTVRVELAGESHHVDTGFIVYNEPNYPRFSALLAELGVATQPSEMSFSVSSGQEDFEYRGNGLALWAQPSNALRPSYTRLLGDILRFHRRARRLVEQGTEAGTLEEFIAAGRHGHRLAPHYLVPLGSAIWSADPTTFTSMPARTFAEFLDHHGMLRLKGRPTWRTVSGGAARYVERLRATLPGRIRQASPVLRVVRNPDEVTVVTSSGPERFDGAVMAMHSDQALRLLADPTPAELQVLGAIRYQPNVATLHTDRRLLPRRRWAWASWNAYLPPCRSTRPTVTYWMNSLQRIGSAYPLCVTLNREDEVDPSQVLGRWIYHHPVLDAGAVAAQQRRPELQGCRRTWFCGAYWGYGFHEDGVQSAAEVAHALGAPVPEPEHPARSSP
jgi:predicted NAD/FAD-binding protein